MKRRQLLKEFKEAARDRGLAFTFERAGREHDLYRCGTVSVAIPRHGEIGPRLEFRLRRDLEPEFGERWWR